MNKPFDHQKKSLAHADTSPIVFDCSDPGTGKTAVAIWIDTKLRTKRQIKKTLVLAPKTLLRTVWFNDFRKFAPATRVVVSTAGKHEDCFKQDADVYVTNIDAIKWLAQQPASFFKDFGFVVVDESSAYKHATSQRSKAASRVLKHFKYRRLMTGTPNSNSITDLWHQVFLLDEGKRLGRSFFGFRNAVCHPIQRGRNVQAVEWVDKPGAEDVVFGTIADIVVRHRFEDCVDIPPNHQYEVKYTMSAAQRKLYEQMKAAAVAELKDDKVLTAINAAAVNTKLLQIASGAVYTSPDDYTLVDKARYELILELVEARQHSLVMFLWKHQRDMLVAEAEKAGIAFAVIDGSVSEQERNGIVARYQAGQFQTIFAHPKSAAHGLTLTKGTATIWASPTYDLELFKQGSKRQHRIGQTQKTETIVVLAENSRDEDAYDAMLGKNTRMESFLSLLETA